MYVLCSYHCSGIILEVVQHSCEISMLPRLCRYKALLALLLPLITVSKGACWASTLLISPFYKRFFFYFFLLWEALDASINQIKSFIIHKHQLFPAWLSHQTKELVELLLSLWVLALLWISMIHWHSLSYTLYLSAYWLNTAWTLSFNIMFSGASFTCLWGLIYLMGTFAWLYKTLRFRSYWSHTLV